MIADLRGALGTQVLNLMQAQAMAFVEGKTLTGCRLSVQNVHEFSRKEYVTRVFAACPHVEVSDAFHKARFTLAGIRALADRLDEVLAALAVAETDQPALPLVVHVRLGDRQPTALATYERLLRGLDSPRVIGSHPDTLRQLAEETGAVYVEQDAVADWHLARRAGHVIGCVSTFTLSAMACGAGRLSMLPQDGPIPALTSTRDREIMDWLVRACERVSWY